MIQIGEYNTLKVKRLVDFGVYLDGNEDGILLPKRYVPANIKLGDEIKVFIYHDSENRLIATTLQPHGIVGDIVKLKVRTTTPHGAFLDNGIMKDVFVPRTKQITEMLPNNDYLVKIYIDNQTGRLVASEKIDNFLSNEVLTIKELDPVNLIIYRKTNIGYATIINNTHLGLLHSNEIFRPIAIGEKHEGFIKKIYNKEAEAIDFKIDVSLGKQGYKRVEDETQKVLRLIKENDGFIPFHDKSNPEEIYAFFGMSKKAFKMATGNLFKQRLIVFEETGCKLVATN
jgi:uncharacterized protein